MAQLTRMATACPADLAGLRDRALLLLTAAGLGRGALVGLEVEQVHFGKVAVDRVGVSQVCPFDLHVLVPMTDQILRLGPDDPVLGWPWEHWGTTQPLRHVALADRTGERTAELARWGAWLVMAATLAMLRSRLLLLPGDTPEARAEDEAEALRRRLVSRAQVRAATDWLERRPQFGRDVFGCGTGQRRHDNGRVGDITELLRACLVALDVPAQAEVYRPRPPTLGQVSDAIARLRQLLDALLDGSPLMAFLPEVDGTEPQRVLRGRVAVSSTPVAGLELARAGVLALDQEAPGRRSGCAIGMTAAPSRMLSGLMADAISWPGSWSHDCRRRGRRRFSRDYRVGSLSQLCWPRGMWRSVGQGRGPGRSIGSSKAR
jgi:chromatin segregation and condensation protein Rec8/ScpA/Scc1 (kleisin family)